MSGSITHEAIAFASNDGETKINGHMWMDASCPKHLGIVQLEHGMAEHVCRYEPFAHALARNGFVVAGHDHLGHGASVASPEDWGCLPAQNGARILVDDAHSMRSAVISRMGTSLPFFIFGHSMGSFVVRSYITRYADGLSGAIICGTGHIPPMKSNVGNALARFVAMLRGERYKSKLLDSMSVGAYSKAIENPRTPLDWLSLDNDNVDAYIADERCGFMFSAGGNAVLTKLTGEVCSPRSARKIPPSLPLLYIAGAEDPVGDMGKGVRTSAKMARDAGVTDIDLRIYENMRHEILNEADRDRVYEDVIAWLRQHA